MTLKKQDKSFNFEFDAPILGLDIGTKRIGMAYLARGVQVVLPLGAVDRAQSRGEVAILSRCAQDKISSIVFGMPLDVQGKKTPKCDNIERFCTRLFKRNPELNFWYVDEYLSSEEAKDRLSTTERRRRVGDLDSVSACLFIEQVMQAPQVAKFWTP